MSKIKIISPVHIGSGNNYYIVYSEGNRIWTLDDALETLDSSNSHYTNFYQSLLNERNLSRTDFISKFNLNINKLKCKEKKNNFEYYQKGKIIGNIYETSKENDRLLIPGSTLKGYFNNVLFYDIIINNELIRNYLMNEYKFIYEKNNEKYQNALKFKNKKELSDISRSIERVWNNKIENYIKDLLQFIGFRDVCFSNKVDLYEVDRYGKNNKVLPQGSYETIPVNEEYEGNLYFNLANTSIDLMDNKIDNIKKGIDELLNKEKIKYQHHKVLINFIDEIYDRIVNFIEWFPNANRHFISNVLNYEEEFIHSINNEKIDFYKTKLFIDELKKMNNDRIILQIGKSTNHLLKTLVMAFKEYFNKYFEIIFSPSSASIEKIKKEPRLLMMPLAKEDDLGSIMLGFIEVEL